MNTTVHRVRPRAGFSLVEVMASLAAASVLALTTGNLLFYGYRAWSEDVAAVEMQRDAGAAADLLGRALRAADGTNVTATTSQISVVLEGVERTFTAVGSDFVYDPDTSASGDEMVVIRGALQSIETTYQTNAIDVALLLGGPGPDTRYALHVTYRN